MGPIYIYIRIYIRAIEDPYIYIYVLYMIDYICADVAAKAFYVHPISFCSLACRALLG